MNPHFELPDWYDMALVQKMPEDLSVKFLRETVNNNINFYWQFIISNPNRDNSEVVDIWEKVCNTPLAKEEFVNWYSKQPHFKSQGPYYTYKDVLRFMTHKKYTLDKQTQ